MNNKLQILPNFDGTFDVVTVREFRDSPPEIWTVHYSNLSWTSAQDALEYLSNYPNNKGF